MILTDLNDDPNTNGGYPGKLQVAKVGEKAEDKVDAEEGGDLDRCIIQDFTGRSAVVSLPAENLLRRNDLYADKSCLISCNRCRRLKKKVGIAILLCVYTS